MAITKTKITGDIALPDGTIPSQSSVTFTMTGFDTDAVADATIAPRSVTSVLSDAGALDVDLWSNEDGERTTFYNVRLNIYNGNSPKIFDVGKIEVPTTGGPYDLNDLLPIAPPSGATVDEYIAQLQSAVAAAEAAADTAVAAATPAAELIANVRVTRDAFSELASVTASDLDVGDYARVMAVGAVYQRAADAAADAHLDYSGSGGVKWYVVTGANGVTPMSIGAIGTGDDSASIIAWLDVLEGSGLTGWVDRDYYFASTVSHSGAVRIRGAWSDAARLVYTGTGDGLVLTGAVDLDGIVIDGNLSASAVPEVSSPEVGAICSIHGPVTSGGAYLSGVRLGRVRVQNSRRRTGLLLANLSNFNIEHIEVIASYGHGIMLNGLKDGIIKSYRFDKIGNLAAEGSRLGAGIAMFTEGSIGKKPSEWYDSTGIQPTLNVEIGCGQGSRTTDTAIYLHDTYATGLTGVRFGHFQGILIGKDGIKFRDGATYCSISSAQIEKVALRGAVIEDSGTDNCNMSVDIRESGYDSLGEWLGGDRNYTGGTGEGESLNTVPGGIKVTDSSGSVVTGTVRSVRDAPDDDSEGHALTFSDCDGCTVDITALDCDGMVRFNAITNCTLRAKAINMGRNGIAGTSTAAVYCNDAGSECDGNVIEVIAGETSGAVVQDYALRINGTGTNFDISVKYGASDFNFPSGIVTRCDSATAVYRGPDQIAGRENVSFDGFGIGTITHDSGVVTPMFFTHEGTSNYGVKLNSSSASTATLGLYDLSTGSAVASTTRVINWVAIRGRSANGWTY